MPQKNEITEIEITAVSSDGNGIGRLDGMAVFVPRCCPGDRLRVRIVKVLSSYCFGTAEEILAPAASRCPPGCGVYGRCGGCSLRQMGYSAELEIKRGWVADALRRIGGFDLQPGEIIPSPLTEGYRNKAQYPLGIADGRVRAGFYAPRSHRIVPAEDCPLQPEVFGGICRAVCSYIEESGAAVYDEGSGRGLFRHIYLRRGETTGQIMVCLVINGRRIPRQELLLQKLSAYADIATVVLNINTRNTNVILGDEETVLLGSGYIEDTMAGVKVEISPRSFYQVNRQGADKLYAEAARLAALGGSETLLDLYCGAGTIGLSMAGSAGSVIGVETVAAAVRDAESNARRNGITNARFIEGDAGQAAAQLAADGLRPDVVVLDPPRKGCDAATLDAVTDMSPSRVVMVSCNPATAARDLKHLCEQGYRLLSATPVDMFPRTSHVECVSLLARQSRQ